MKFFTVLLFASLVTASLAVLPGSEDKLHMKTQHTSATSQSTPTNHISKESTSSKDSFKESSIFREDFVAKGNVVIECTKSKSQKAQAGITSGASQLEETTGPTISAETTTEGKLTKLNQAMEKNMDKIINNVMSDVEGIIPGAMRP